jgi:hypothetical protein
LSYVNYDLSLYRQGYRPYGETDPFAATMLSGVKPTPAGHPFAPWRLRGMGQNPPFTESGGYKLHGLRGAALGFLGAAVPDGSVVTYTGKWAPTYTIGAQDLISAVAGAIAGSGLQVTNIQSDAGLTDSTVFGMTVQPTPFNVALQIQVATGQGGFSSASDVASIVNHAVYAVTGAMPLASSTPTVQAPASGAVAAGPAGPVPDPSSAFNLPSLPNLFGTNTSPGTTGTSTWEWLALAGVGLLVAVPLLKRIF